MRNSSNPFTMRATAASSVVCIASPNRLDAPSKVTLPQRMAGVALQCRVEHPLHLGARVEPSCDPHRRRGLAFQPNRQAAHAAQREKTVVGGGGVSERERLIRDGLEQLFGRGGDHPDHQVRMPREVLGARLDRDVDTMLEGPEEHRRRPGIVHRDQGAAIVGGLRDRGHVLHLERERAGRLGVDETRVRTHRLRDPGTGRGVVEAGLDPVAAEDLGAEPPGRPIHRVGHEHVVAGAHDGRDRHRHRREPGAGHHGAVPAFDGRDGLGERPRVLGPGRPVGDVVVAVVTVEPVDVAVEMFGEDRRRPMHRKVDRPLCAHRRPAESDEPGVLFHSSSRWRCTLL